MRDGYVPYPFPSSGKRRRASSHLHGVEMEFISLSGAHEFQDTQNHTGDSSTDTLCWFSSDLCRSLPEFLMLAPRHNIRSYLHPSYVSICMYFLFQAYLDWSGSSANNPCSVLLAMGEKKNGSHSPLVTWLAPRLGTCSEDFRSNLFVLHIRNSRMHCLAAFVVQVRPILPTTHLLRTETYNGNMLVVPKHCLLAELG